MGRPSWRSWWTLGLAVFVVVAAFFGYALAESYRLEVEPVTFAGADVPTEFDGTRIVLLTDIHLGLLFSQERVRALVDRVNALEPDLIVLGGDYVYMDTGNEESCFVELARLEAPLGVYAVLGNHDYGEHDRENGRDPGPAMRAIEAAGITLLDNRAVWVEKAGARVRLGGVADYEMDRPDAGPTLDGTRPGDLVLLVSHNPDYAEELPPGEVDLVMAGHTHGGQVTFFGLGAPYLPSDYGQKYRTGLVVTDRTTVIVSNGIGTIFPPIRFFALPQIVEITLRGDSAPGAGTSGAPAGLHP